MKLAKKLATFLMALCLVVPCFSMLTCAADGKLMFTDPNTATGETVEVKGVVEVAANLSLEDITINLTYDTTMLRFLNGEGITETEAGKLTFEKLGTENGNRVEYFMYFTALEEGSTTISIADCNIWLTTDEKVYPVLGSSVVTIALGTTPVPDTPTDEPTENPQGDIVIPISDTTSITLLSEISHITLPQRYTATTIIVNGIEFPAWKDTEKSNLCILYATNSNGETALYQFDSTEGTYQRFEAPQEQAEEPQKQTGSFLVTLTALLGANMSYVVLGAGAAFILFVIIIIVLSIKLYNRNAELDELYEEYGLYEDDEDDEDEKPVKPAKKEKSAKPSKPVKVVEEDVIITMPEEVEEVRERKTEVKEIPVEKRVEQPVVEEDDDDYYDDDMDIDFEVDFIDLDD